jgi:hypothetical protein
LFKKSYHFIHAIPSVLFENSKTLGIYVRSIFQSLLLSVARHKCSSFSLSIDVEPKSIRHIISLLSPYVTELQTKCSDCFILNDMISAADIAHLIVCNQKDEWVLSVDLHVYSKNQQFRMYDSIKTGQNNPLVMSFEYPFNQTKSHCYFDILHKSLITNVNHETLPLVILDKQQLFLTQKSLELIPKLIDLNTNGTCCLQNDLKTIESKRTNSSCYNEQRKKVPPIVQNLQPRPFNSSLFDSYIPFVNGIITQNNNYIGRIQSCVEGKRNTNKLFFNITGNYRFCPKIGTHHKRNSTAIIIDMSNNTFAIRCKDAQCDNTSLTWYSIHK